MDFGNLVEQVEQRFGKVMGYSLVGSFWLAAVSFSLHMVYIDLAAPLYHFVSTHNFARIIHYPSNVWTDILFVIGLIVFILIVTACSAFIVIWFFLRLLAAIIVPIVNAFKLRAPTSTETKPQENGEMSLQTQLEKL